jgi:hypothetical protein
MIDEHTTRVAALANRIPDSVMFFQIGDRPHRGFITVPSAALVAQRASMNLPTSAAAPIRPPP